MLVLEIYNAQIPMKHYGIGGRWKEKAMKMNYEV
jgi:hypothetical protein